MGCSKGNPEALIVPYDPSHQACGEGLAKDFPYIYFADPLAGAAALYTTVCVTTCPTASDMKLLCYPNSLITTADCLSASDYSAMFVDDDMVFYKDEDFASATVYLYDTNVVGTACLPSSTALLKKIGTSASSTDAQNAVSAFQKTWKVMLYCILIAIVVSFLFINLLRFCTGIITWAMIFSIIMLFAAGGIFILINTDSKYFGAAGAKASLVASQNLNAK